MTEAMAVAEAIRAPARVQTALRHVPWLKSSASTTADTPEFIAYRGLVSAFFDSLRAQGRPAAAVSAAVVRR